jgi:hypothetical protein
VVVSEALASRLNLNSGIDKITVKVVHRDVGRE